eukprot:480992_1
MDDMQKDVIKPGDFVAYREDQKSKINNNDSIGSVVTASRLSPRGKWLYDLKNQITQEKRFNKTRGHLHLMFTPIRDGRLLIQNELSRINDMERKKNEASLNKD